ncbi:MAG: type II toxin-antitoxin system RelE/ParE family toxin, partial [Microcystaceae cyanobacterium]
PIKWLKKALRNVEQAHDYIAKDNPAAAVRVVLKIQAAVAQLVDSPLSGRPGRVEGTRELVVLQTPYIVNLPDKRREYPHYSCPAFIQEISRLIFSFYQLLIIGYRGRYSMQTYGETRRNKG